MPARKPAIPDNPIEALGLIVAEWDDDYLDEYLAGCDDDERAVILQSLDIATGGNQDRYFPGARDKQIPPVDDWLVWLVMAGRGAGKALALDTPLPTPMGWTTMGDVAGGDWLLGADGRPVEVLQAHTVLLGRECYGVEFSDGSVIVADAEHLWLTSTHAARKAAYRRVELADRRKRVPRRAECEPTVRTTAEIAATLTQGSRADRNHSVPMAQPIKLPEADLPIDPYVLGFWLGDGSSATAEVTVGDLDAEIVLRLLADCGEPVTGPVRRKPGAACATYPIGGAPSVRDHLGRMAANGSLHSRLRLRGLIRNKHIPPIYLRASIDQRRALLAGLLDSDGHAPMQGNLVELCLTSQRLAADAYELIVSLGWRCTMKASNATLYGRIVGRRWRLTFRPTESVFRLSRKSERLRFDVAQRGRHNHRMIVAVRPVASRPVRCVTVAADDGLYLCGRSMIPTHNTRTGSEWIVDQALGHEATWAVMAPTFGDGRDICFEGRGDLGQPSGILSVLERRGHRDRANWNRSMGELRIDNGSLLKLISADDPDRARGWNFAGGWADELGSWPYPDAFDQLRFALRVGDMPRLVVTTTPRPTILIRGLVEQAREGHKVIVTRGSTWENRENLSAPALAELERRYGGTRLGRQELEGELLDDIEGALWKAENIVHVSEHPKLSRIMVGIDPSTWGADTGGEHVTVGRGIETGIVVAGIVDGLSPKCYVLEDLSGRYSPDEWAQVAVNAWRRWSTKAHTLIVPETNAGGGMVTATIRLVDPAAAIYRRNGRAGVHAAQGKRARAEPVAGLYEQRRCEHVGYFEALETQMKEWDSSMPWSPDRIDALVWAITALEPWVLGGSTTTAPPSRRVLAPKPGARASVTRIGRPGSRRR